MKIGFDAKRYFHNQSGLGNYSRDLINTLIQISPQDSFFLFDKKKQLRENTEHLNFVKPIFFGFLWRLTFILKSIKRNQIDVYHGLSNELPFGPWPKKTKKVVTIHDVIFKSHAKQYKLIDRLIYHFKTKHAVKTADAIVSTTHFTSSELSKYYNLDKSKMKVIYQTCGELHWKNYSSEQIETYRINSKLPQEFILYVSSFQARKNHLQLLNAFIKCRNNTSKLVLAGRRGGTYNSCLKFIQENQLSERVILLTEVNSEDLPLLYRAASGFCYPSMIEGFGIPLLEAACAGLPLAVNEVDVFKELAPEGSLYFNANDIPGFSDALSALSEFKKQNYSIYLKQFQPENAAQQMLELYKSLR